MKRIILSLYLLLSVLLLQAENGYDLWLRYTLINDLPLRQTYSQYLKHIVLLESSPTGTIIKKEFALAAKGLTGTSAEISEQKNSTGKLIIGLVKDLGKEVYIARETEKAMGTEGYWIHQKQGKIYIIANQPIGLLYGSFQLIQIMQRQEPVNALNIVSAPKIKIRMLNHWDNLNGTVERGYAGSSIWNWHSLPDYIDQRYVDYARANASIGINAVSITNVNANAHLLTPTYLHKLKALADLFRPYGIKVFLTARFSAPMEIGGLKTADPLNTGVQQWWKDKTNEIYSIIPDFGGFLVKANSEGQPGPQDYKRHHGDGANMLADALAPHGGLVMWRAFVYNPESNDRFKQAYEEFKPLDGQFRSNVIVQVKNGPIDFQPREPFSPLFGAMKNTPLMMEFQLTQEYLGQGTHLVYLAPLFKEVLETDTYTHGKGSTIDRIIDGSVTNQSITGMAGVSNIGSAINWTNHPFAQANWYAYGRLCWDHSLSSARLAEDWIKQTWSIDHRTVKKVQQIMLASREAAVNYMTPIGLTHIMYNGHHYGPMPWGNSLHRPDWNPVYYHKADSIGIGFNRTISGTNALAQYAPEWQQRYGNINTCPDDYLLWFHHVSWSHKMHSGRTVWEELCYKYNSGVDTVRSFIKQWDAVKSTIDAERFNQVKQLLQIQLKDAIWWRNACLLYFQTFSKKPIPSIYEQPDRTLEDYQKIRILYAPGN